MKSGSGCDSYTYTGWMIVLGDVFWGRVNSCRADRSVLFRVGGAAVAVIIVGGLDFTPLLHTHTPFRPWAVGCLCLVVCMSHEEEPWV